MKSRTMSYGVFSALMVSLFIAAATVFAADKKPAGESLDEELLKSLDSELLEGLETIPADKGSGEEKEVGEESHDAATSDEDTFSRISKRMREVEQLITKMESAKNTKKLQKDIATDLDRLIAELEKQCQKCQGGASSAGKPSEQQTTQREQVKQPARNSGQGQHDAQNPAKDATERLGKDEARRAALERMKSLLKEDRWGELPAKAREQMLQLSPEQFLPKYELLIEEYYKRLAEEPSK